MIRLLKLYILIVFLITGCKEEPSEPGSDLNEKFKFNVVEYQDVLKSRFSDEFFSIYSKDSSFQYLDSLKKLYSERNFNPFFIKSFEEMDFVDSLLIILEKAGEHGLDPNVYHLNLISGEFYKAVNDTADNPDRLVQLANTEIFISDAILKYAYHIRYGVVNPKLLYPDSYTLPVIDTSKRDLPEPLRQDNLINYLYSIQPGSKKYQKLQQALKNYNRFTGMHWETITINKNKLEPGDKDSSISLIADRLIILGILDTSKIKTGDYSFYDSILVEPVKHFQRLHGLNEDGVIGKTTIDRLNITPEEYITTIKLNLERFRWNDYSDTSKYILVNIPDFKLFAIENGKKVFETKVCTGSRRTAGYKNQMQLYRKTKKLYHKPDDWETPCLYGEISYMVLNPTWTVPASIIREEIFRELKSDSTYLHRKNFKVYQNGVELNLNEVNLTELSSERIPYTIVQDPGAGNALGKIKFMFKNPFGVYLHDTPSRLPFSYSNRAVSHGCVRLEKPLMFAEYILEDHSKWNIDYLKIEIGQKPEDPGKVAEYKQQRSELRKKRSFGKTTEIVLDKIIPLFIDYYTAWVDENGEVNFRDDVYRKDEILKKHLYPEKKFDNLVSSVK